jgi:hypothetical protein
MDNAKDIISNILLRLSKEINSLSENELNLLEKGNYEVKIIPSKKTKSERIKSDKNISQSEIPNIAISLNKCTTRECGENLIKDLNKEYLLELARHLDIPAQIRESKIRLIEKIIEATIGYKLRSKAIQGKNQ